MTRVSLSTGFSLIELLVSLAVTGIGLVGVLQLYAYGQSSELESYQRSQALVLLDDMANRLDANRGAAPCYAVSDAVSGAPSVGEGNSAIFSCTGAGTSASRALADSDLAQWDLALKGGAERRDGVNVGGVRGARGCVWSDVAGDVYVLSVSWQGRAPGSVPTNTCGQGEYGDEQLRRVVSTTVRLADLN